MSHSDYFDLSGSHAWITGGGSGLGRHFALLLARHGATVTVSGRRNKPLEQTAAEIEAAGGTCRACVLDVTAHGDRAGLAERLHDVDILINNASIVGEGSAITLADEDWNAVIATNLTGMFTMAQAAACAMREGKRPGSIVNIASILGFRQGTGVTAYAVAKAGVVQLTKQLALEFARHRIRVNALAPGYIATDLNREFLESEPGRAMISRIPQRRLGQPNELDVPLLLLASDAGSYMTGSILVADGGHLVSPL